MNFDDPIPYADIIDLPHHISQRHPQMPMKKRAAQFSPFAAVSGHDEAILETARVTEKRIELSEEEMALLDEKLQHIQEHIKEQPEITVTYFQPDDKKNGGAYVTVTGPAKRIDLYSHMLALSNGILIPINGIIAILGE